MDEEKKVVDQFLEDIPVADELDAFGEPTIVPEVKEEVIEPKPRDNREARRAKEALQKEREANIFLTAKLEALSETQKFSRDSKSDDVDHDLLTLYGSDDNGRKAAEITQKLLNKTREQAKAEALEVFQSQQEAATREVSNQEKVLENMIEQIEDEYDVDLTSNTPQSRKSKQGFYALLEKVSPKDSEGNVKDFADPLATWEMYQNTQQKSDSSRAKDLGSRSMVKSGASGESKLEQSATERYLKENGFI